MRRTAKEVLYFGAVGALNTLIGLSGIWLSMWLGADPLLSNAIGYGLGLSISFTLNRLLTFRNDNTLAPPRGIAPDAGRFLIAFLAAWLMNIVVVSTGMMLTNISPYVLQIAGMGTYTACFFVLCKFWAFAR